MTRPSNRDPIIGLTWLIIGASFIAVSAIAITGALIWSHAHG